MLLISNDFQCYTRRNFNTFCDFVGSICAAVIDDDDFSLEVIAFQYYKAPRPLNKDEICLTAVKARFSTGIKYRVFCIELVFSWRFYLNQIDYVIIKEEKSGVAVLHQFCPHGLLQRPYLYKVLYLSI